MLHASCSKLIEHIITQSSTVIEKGKPDSSSRNVSVSCVDKLTNYIIQSVHPNTLIEQSTMPTLTLKSDMSVKSQKQFIVNQPMIPVLTTQQKSISFFFAREVY